MAGREFLELFIGVRIPAPEPVPIYGKKQAPQDFSGKIGTIRIMETEYFRADDPITLTLGEWQELVSSIQNLVQANSALLETVSELMAQRNEAFSLQAPPVPGLDPYDLTQLNLLIKPSSGPL